MFQAFLDESGTHPEAPVLSVGGFYGNSEQWQTFRQLWVPRSRRFHAKDSTSLFPDLCSAIEKSKVSGVLLTIGKRTYKTYANDHLKTALGNPYSICAFLCAITICERLNSQPVSIILEEGQPNLSFVKATLEGMMSHKSEWSIAAVEIAKKSDFIELHTADFLSHIASSHDLGWMQRLFEADRLEHGHVTEKMLQGASPQVTALFSRARAARKEAKKLKMTDSDLLPK
jgi:hypothetical protein